MRAIVAKLSVQLQMRNSVLDLMSAATLIRTSCKDGRKNWKRVSIASSKIQFVDFELKQTSIHQGARISHCHEGNRVMNLWESWYYPLKTWRHYIIEIVTKFIRKMYSNVLYCPTQQFKGAKYLLGL